MIVLVMGVVGAGKTTIGQMLAAKLGWEFVDGDSFHPPANIEKMKRGIPLDDADRLPWLNAIHDAIVHWIADHKNVVLSCSALKRSYRDQLVISPEVQIVYLKGSREVISQRLRLRHGHFATEQLLASQLATLEVPENAIAVDINQPPPAIVEDVIAGLGLA